MPFLLTGARQHIVHAQLRRCCLTPRRGFFFGYFCGACQVGAFGVSNFHFRPLPVTISQSEQIKRSDCKRFSRESSESEEQCCSNAADHNGCDYTLIRRTYHTNGPLKCNGKLLGKNFFQLEPSVGDGE